MKLKVGEQICPLLKGKCVERACKWYIQLSGTNPNTGQSVDQFDCAIAWFPILQIEMAQKTNQVGAEISKLRSEVSKTVIQAEEAPSELSKENRQKPFKELG